MQAKTKHKNSRIITIFRAGSFLSRAQGPAIEEHFASSKVSVGSYFESVNSSMVGSGLTFEEQNILLPLLVDAPKEDREFRKLVRAYYENIDTKIPYGTGCILETGLIKDNNAPISEDNLPIELIDFVRYRHAYHHPFMAKSKEEAESNALMQFYIFDKNQVQDKAAAKTITKDAAMAMYLTIKKDESKVNMMLTLLNIDPREFPQTPAGLDQKIQKLRSLAEGEKTAAKFAEVHDAEDFDIRYWLESMKTTGVLKVFGGKYVDAETQKTIGNNLEEAIFFFKDEANSATIGILKAKQQEALRAPLEGAKRITQPLKA
jgi:hypothetical protein